MRILICDDETVMVEKLVSLCGKYREERGMDMEIRGTVHPEEIERDLPDLLLLDVEMPEASGIEIKDRLAAGDLPLIVFVTSHEEIMKQAFGRNVIGFLSKPVEYDQLVRCLDAAAGVLSLDRIVRFEDGSAVSSRQIVTITVEREYSQVLLCDGEKKAPGRKSMRAWEEELGSCGFLRISDSCMVNCRYIQNFEGCQVMLKVMDLRFRISRRRKQGCAEKYREYCIKAARYL